jgi:hypothetical protein
VTAPSPAAETDRPIVVARLLNTPGILGIVAVLGSLYYQFVVGITRASCANSSGCT